MVGWFDLPKSVHTMQSQGDFNSEGLFILVLCEVCKISQSMAGSMISLSVESESLVSVTLSVTFPPWLLVVGSICVGSAVTTVRVLPRNS